jgi:hypothetical protein
MKMLRAYLIIFKAQGVVHEWIRLYESITECVHYTRAAIRKEYGDHKIQLVEELSDAEFEALTQE